MGLPNPTAMVRRQTEVVGAKFDSKRNEITGQINAGVEAQIANIKAQESGQIDAMDSKIGELMQIKTQLPPDDPRRAEVEKQVGMLQEQKKQVKAQIRLALASVKANAAREKENIKTRLEREKATAIRGAVEAALAQYSMLMAQRRAKAQGGAADELRSGNRG
jgi:hypothetical protein